MITMSCRQITPNSDEKTELVTLGTCFRKNGVLRLSYEDTEATGYAGSTTSVQIGKDSLVSILRTGTANSDLTLEPGKKHFCLYQTPFGSMTLGVDTKAVRLEETEAGGSVEMEYSTDLNASFLADNEIQVRWEYRGAEEMEPEG